jgi:hypothetical protein
MHGGCDVNDHVKHKNDNQKEVLLDPRRCLVALNRIGAL